MAKIHCFLQVLMIHCTKEKWCNDQNGIVLVQTIVHKEDVKVFNYFFLGNVLRKTIN